MKKVLVGIIFIILYLFLGVIISYKKQPRISDEYAKSFNVYDYYSEEKSIDRARVIEDNMEALLLRLYMIESAEEEIILSTFDFKSDNSGKDILGALLNAAEQGIDVKILVDGFSATLHMTNNRYFMALSTMENVEIKIYNYINPFKPWKSMGRLHDKYLIIDNNLYLLGGRNTYDFFLGESDYENIDRDLFVLNTQPNNKDSSIYQVKDYFHKIWDYEECKLYHNEAKKGTKKKVVKGKEELQKRYVDNLEKYPLLTKGIDFNEITYETNKISLLYNPTHIYSKEPTVFYSLIELMKEAENEVKIHTPYIVCNDMMYDALRSISNNRAEVSLMTNSVANNGNPFGASDYRINKKEILDTGMSIYEYEGGTSYHGKSITIDDNISIIGSFNMDMRSVYLSTELMLVVDSEDINKQLKGYMEEYEEESVHIIDEDNEVIPEGVTKQELTLKTRVRIWVATLFNWLRFLF